MLTYEQINICRNRLAVIINGNKENVSFSDWFMLNCLLVHYLSNIGADLQELDASIRETTASGGR